MTAETVRRVHINGARNWPNSREMRAELDAARAEDREFSDAAAAAVASWWQSPRGAGAVFAALCGGFPVPVADLCDAIYAARRELDTMHLPYGEFALNRDALDFLGTWALNSAV
jgi:hypothetical protein